MYKKIQKSTDDVLGLISEIGKFIRYEDCIQKLIVFLYRGKTKQFFKDSIYNNYKNIK